MKIKDIAKVTNGKSDVKDAVNDGKYLFFDRSTIVKKSNKFLFDSASIIIPGEDSRMIFEPRYYEGKFNLHQRCYVIYDLDQEYSTKYLYYKLKTLTKHFANVFVGSTVPSLRLDHITDLDIEFPKLDVQQKIASVLSSLDAKIDLNSSINTRLEAMAKTLYDYWFVQFDFPNEDGKPYKSSGGKMVWSEELKREIPKGWEVGELADLFTLNPSISLKVGAISSYIDMDALPTDGFMTKEVQKKAFNGGVKFQNGDLVIARITPCLENGKTGLITLLDSDEVGFGSTEFIVLRGKQKPLSCFAACLSRSELFRKYAIANMTGTSGRKRVEAKLIEKFPLAIPPQFILDRFEKVINPNFQITTVNTKQNQHLSQHRDWLLPMLMNGQVKVQ